MLSQPHHTIHSSPAQFGLSSSTSSCDWRRVSTTGSAPCPRSFHTSTLCPNGLPKQSVLKGIRSGVPLMVVFGGRDQSRSLNDLYVLDLEAFTWHEVCPDTSADPAASQWPGRRAYHTATLVGNDTLYVYGGRDVDATFLSDMHSINLTTGAWSLVPQANPTKRAYHSTTVEHGAPRTLLVIGGHNGYSWHTHATHFNLDTNIWTPIDLAYVPLAPRITCACQACNGVERDERCPQCHVTCCSHLSAVMQRHAGKTTPTPPAPASGTTGLKRTRTAAEDSDSELPARDAHSCVSIGSKCYLFGGEVAKSFFDTLLCVDTHDGSWSTVSGTTEAAWNAPSSPKSATDPQHAAPSNRAYHASLGLGDSGAFAVWGGYYHRKSTFFNDFRVFDSKRSKWHRVDQSGHVPAARASATLVSLPPTRHPQPQTNEYTTTPMHGVLFGGDNGVEYFNDVHVCSVQGWGSSLKQLVAEFLAKHTATPSPVP